MKLKMCSFGVGASALVLLAAWGSRNAGLLPAKSAAANIASAKMAPSRAVDGYGKLPLSFEVNWGQTDARFRFLARGQGYTLFLNSQEAVLSLERSEASSEKDGKRKNRDSELAAGRFALFGNPSQLVTERARPPDPPRPMHAVLQMRLAGANANGRVKGEQELPGKSNYFIGNDPKKWRTDIPTYAKVRVENVYPGVDLVYYGNHGQLEYDFVVRPGSDPSAIKLTLTSSPSAAGKGSPDSIGPRDGSPVKIDADGDLVLHADGGEVLFHKPLIYQPASIGSRRGTAVKRLVAGSYTINEQNEVAFAIGEYDRTKPLVIDPVLAYSTYLGGSADDWGFGIAVDGSGNAYVTGSTSSTDFPAPNSLQATNHGSQNAFVTKFNAAGSALVYSTYLGGSGLAGDQGNSIAVDGSGNAYVTGSTSSTDFPTANPFQTTIHGYHNAFVAKLSADGSALLYSTYLGGSSPLGDQGYGIAVDSSGNAYVTGSTSSADFPTASPIQGTLHGCCDAFVAMFNPAGSALVYSTYLGGSGDDGGYAIAVDSSGDAYVTGGTSSIDFPTVNPFQAINRGFCGISGCNSNAFVSKLGATGSALVYSTYLGGSGPDRGTSIAVDGSGNAYVTGTTGSHDFPTVKPFQSTNNSFNDPTENAFVTKFNAAGSALVYSTYLGGSGNSSGGDEGSGIAVDNFGNAYLTGRTRSSNFPTTPNAPQPTFHAAPGGGNYEAFVTDFNADGSALVYSTYLGGTGGDVGTGIAVDGSENAYIAGWTVSTDFPTTVNALQGTKHGGHDTFVTKISITADLKINNVAPTATPSGSPLIYTIAVTNQGPDMATNVNIQDTIPAGTTFNSVAASNGSCTAPAPGSTGTVTCTASNLVSGGAITVTLIVNVTAASGNSITDTATANSVNPDPSPADNSATATTTVN